MATENTTTAIRIARLHTLAHELVGDWKVPGPDGVPTWRLRDGGAVNRLDHDLETGRLPPWMVEEVTDVLDTLARLTRPTPTH